MLVRVVTALVEAPALMPDDPMSKATLQPSSAKAETATSQQARPNRE